MLKILPVLFARTDSSRLSHKVLLPFEGDKTIIEYLFNQITDLKKISKHIQDPILSTTKRTCDDSIIKECNKLNLKTFRGSLDPLLRLKELSDRNSSVWYWRINCDSPFIYFDLILEAIKVLKIDSNLYILNNILERSFPYGISVEIFNKKLFDSISFKTLNKEILENISPIQKIIKKNMILCISSKKIIEYDFSTEVRLTLDTKEDYDFFKKLFHDQEFLKKTEGSKEKIIFVYEKKKNEKS